MTLTSRDRKIVLALLPLALVAAYWFLLLSPKFKERNDVQNQVTQAQSALSAAQAKLAQVSGAKKSYATDYETVIRLGKSIPSTVDMPSLLLQLYTAARGTNLTFLSVSTGARSSAAATPATPGAAASATAAAASLPGLDSVPLDFQFTGDFFNLADFFHQMKRFVQVANSKITVRGRLIKIDNFSFKADKFPTIDAEVHATAYLASSAQGPTAGATAAGPATTTTSTTSTPTTSTSGGSSPATPTAAATVTAR